MTIRHGVQVGTGLSSVRSPFILLKNQEYAYSAMKARLENPSLREREAIRRSKRSIRFRNIPLCGNAYAITPIEFTKSKLNRIIGKRSFKSKEDIYVYLLIEF